MASGDLTRAALAVQARQQAASSEDHQGDFGFGVTTDAMGLCFAGFDVDQDEVRALSMNQVATGLLTLVTGQIPGLGINGILQGAWINGLLVGLMIAEQRAGGSGTDA